MTYFIQGETTQRIKIGKTSTAVSERIRLLQTGSPDVLKFLGVCFGPKRSEIFLHNKFSQYRLHGEWFTSEPKIIKFIKENYITDEIAFFHAYRKIVQGLMTFEKALKIGTTKLKTMSNEETSNIIKNMYINGERYNVLTGKRT